jgi:hypothetical protein
MTDASAAEICLPVRLALEAVRRQSATSREANQMAQVVLLTTLITKSGHGLLALDYLAETEAALSNFLANSKLSGDWTFPSDLIVRLTIVVNEHDRQIRECRLSTIVDASNAIERMMRG